jgi:hypothetical protein
VKPLALTAFALLLCAATLGAQAVRGTLVDQASGQPIAGAFVTLLDESGREVSRALTAQSGAFLLSATAAGTYRLRSKRIGFRPSESPLLALAVDQALEYRLEVEAVPVQLPAVIVRGRPQCGGRPQEAAAVAQLWEEAREALAAVQWTQRQRALRFAVASFDRMLPRAGRQVLAERDSAWIDVGRRPFGSIPAEQLARDGYVVTAGTDSLDYYGPDAEVLLGEPFVNTHCFSVQEGGTEFPGLVGLAFEPEPRRRVPDVAGVLWLDRKTLELKVLRFNYTRLRDASLGGQVEFASLASGPWIVTHWWIRTPRLDPGPRRFRAPPRVMGYRESGGTVIEVTSSASTVEYAGVEAVLRGTVVDSSRGGQPLAGAVVWLVPTAGQALSDDSGRFEIAGPFDGGYRVSFRHPRLDSLGIEAEQHGIALARGVPQSLTLSVPPESVVLHRLCPDGLGLDQRVLVGFARDSTGATIPHAQLSVLLSGVLKGAGRADDTGRFIVCGVPGTSLTFSASAGAAAASVRLEFEPGGVVVDGLRRYLMTDRIWRQDLLLRSTLRPPSE